MYVLSFEPERIRLGKRTDFSIRGTGFQPDCQVHFLGPVWIFSQEFVSSTELRGTCYSDGRSCDASATLVISSGANLREFFDVPIVDDERRPIGHPLQLQEVVS